MHYEATDFPPSAGRVIQCSGDDGLFGFVYAIGEIKAVFPSTDVEKQYQQLVPPLALRPSANLQLQDAPRLPDGVSTEAQRLQFVLQKHPFLARAMRWVLRVAGVDAYRVQPRSNVERDALIAAIVQGDPTKHAHTVCIGVEDPSAAPGGELPGVTLDRVFTFGLDELVQQVQADASAQHTQQSQQQIAEIFTAMLQLAQNHGNRSEHRAVNYLCVSYPEIYLPQSGFGAGSSVSTFSAVEARASALGGASRSIVEVILSYTNPSSGAVNKYFTSVDVSGEFPFLVTPLRLYLDR
jgi:hypothetical protein